MVQAAPPYVGRAGMPKRPSRAVRSASCDLLVLGAGAKGAAIAMKASVLNSVGLGPIRTTLVEATGPAAAWMDGNGVASSREVLAISPSKDVGFPYRSASAFGELGASVDEAALRFSWQRYMVEQGCYDRWVDAGSPPVQRRVYGAYLSWVLARASEGVSLVRGRVACVSLHSRGDCWVVDISSEAGLLRYTCRAFVLTGPGVHRTLSRDLDAAHRVLDCDSGRTRIAGAPIESSSDIAIVGGGESALSCMEFIRTIRPDAQLTVYTSDLPMSRVESFVENRVFSDPDSVGWSSLSVQTRRDFIRRSDRGVFGPDRLAAFGYDQRCRFVAGRVVHIASARAGRAVRVEHACETGVASNQHDYLINCTGFDLLEQLRALLSASARAQIERRVGPVWDSSRECDLAVGGFLELDGLKPRLHIPGLAGLSQGPGFANLGSLGILADRVLQPFYLAERAGSRPARRQLANAHA
jgi:mycobactin lysine-N-oxygenase